MAVKQATSPSTKLDIQLFKDQTLGVGSYGKACKARYGSLLCAAKLMHETLFDPEGSERVPQERKHRLPIRRFEQECEVLHTLRHPNVIQYLGMYQDPDTNLPVLLMELMDGSLTHFLESALQQIPFHIQVNFCLDIALALSFLHANKIIHRDLSSNNVLLISNIRAKVTDFGMAMLHIGEQATQFTRTMCPGTDVYMPPEAVKDKPVYTEKIDCFSLGILIIQILTQLFPAPGDRHEEMELDHPGLQKGRKVMVSVPEVEHRKNHIDLIDPNHALLAVVFDCLKDLESDRPSAKQICKKVAALKESAKYIESIKEAGKEVKLESSTLEKEELIKAKEKEILQLKELIYSKDEALAAKKEEIKELKRQLADTTAAKDQEEPNLDFETSPFGEDLVRKLRKERKKVIKNIHKPRQGQKSQSWNDSELKSSKETTPSGDDGSGTCSTSLPQLSFLSINKPWYHGALSRNEAERRLREMDMNSFLVRESTQDSGNLKVSVKNGDMCYHFPIKCGVGKYQIQGTRVSFLSINDLVNFYMQNGLPETNTGKLIQFIMPCTFGVPKPIRSPRKHSYMSIDDDIWYDEEEQMEEELFKEAVVDLHTLPPTPITRNPNPLPPPRRLRAPDPIQPDIVRKPINCPPLPVSTQEDAHAYTLPQRADSPEFDLDLIYITERIIAMSFPATGVESAYRNNLKDVAKMLKTKHEDNYMVFNLSERSYDISCFNNQVLDFGWPDNLAPSLERLSSVCKSIKSWLDSDPLHVAVVHCKGGKGRIGCIIAAFMHYSKICHSATAALDQFSMNDNKLGGVTQPSQRKYVHYFADLLSGKIDLKSPPVILQHLLIYGIPNFDGKGGCQLFLKVYENMQIMYTSGLYVCDSDKERVKITAYGGLKLQGEVLVKCHHTKVHTGIESIFQCQFHTAVVGEELRLVYKKGDLDDAFKDKRFGDNVRVELLFKTIEGYNAAHTSTRSREGDCKERTGE